MARLFDGDDDRIDAALGPANSTLNGAFTFALCIRPDSSSYGGLINTTGGNDWAIWQDGTTLWMFTGSGPERSFGSALTIGDWHLVLISKASGAQTPRAHVYNIDTDTWAHINGSGTLVDDSASAGRNWVIGREDFVGATFDGAIAAIGMYGSTTSDGVAETMKTWAAWKAASPAIAWDFRTIPLVDEGSAGTANQTSITGTTADTPPAGFFSNDVQLTDVDFAGAGTLDVTVSPHRGLTAALLGEGSLAASLSALRNLSASMAGEGTMSVALTVETPVPPIDPRRIQVRETPRLAEHIIVTAPSGKPFRWSEDELEAANVPANSQHSSTAPGGHASWSATLPRKPGVDYGDMEPLSDVQILDASGDTVWNGRLTEIPKISGDQMAVTPAATGYQAALEDVQGINWLGVDPRSSEWAGPSTGRQLQILTAGVSFATEGAEAEIAADVDQGISHSFADFPGTPIRQEAWYKAIAPIDRVFYILSTTNVTPQPEWETRAYILNRDYAYTVVQGGTNHNGNPTTVSVFVATSDQDSRYALFVSAYSGTFSGRAPQMLRWHNVAVFGRHGINRRPSALGTPGLLASDIITYNILHWANGITPRNVVQSDFVIPVSVIPDTTVAGIITDSNKYQLWNWAVWGKSFDYAPPGQLGRRWKARVGPSQLRETGKSLKRVRNGVIVSFTDVDGTQKSVGPPGSTADVIDAALLDTDPLNPANMAGERIWESISMRDYGTVGSATRTGVEYLRQLRQLDRSGEAVIVGWIEDPSGRRYPHTAVEADDEVEFVDSNDPSPRLVVDAQHNRAARETQITLDAPRDAMEAIVDRMQIVVQGVV